MFIFLTGISRKSGVGNFFFNTYCAQTAPFAALIDFKGFLGLLIKQDLGFVKKIQTNLINLYHFQAINYTCIKARAPASALGYSGVELQLVLGFFGVTL